MTTEDNIDVNDILEGAARALFLSAYALASVDSDLPAAGPGEDWDDVAPDTPQTARDSAQRLLDGTAGYNIAYSRDDLIRRLCVEWIQAGGDGGRRWTAEERFGHCLAMQALGHGVGLIDDIRPDSGYCRPYVPNWESHYIGGKLYAT